MFGKFFTAKNILHLVTCKIKHLESICKNVLEPREVDGCKTFLQILQITTIYLQAVFDPAKNVCNIFANVLA